MLWLEGLGKLKKFSDLGARTHDFLACGIVPQLSMLPHALPPQIWIGTA
jgi:hypothetical protein